MAAPTRVGLTGSRSLAAQHSIPSFPRIVLNPSVLACYLSPVFAKLHPRRRTPARTAGKVSALLFTSHKSPTCPDLVGVTSHPFLFIHLRIANFLSPFLLIFIHRMGGRGRVAMAFLKNNFKSAGISRGMNNLASTRVRDWSGGVVPFQPLIENPGRLGTAERQLPTLGFPRATNH
jgi:hypothetical protein